jgi:ketosteroid isomerase-like protein
MATRHAVDQAAIREHIDRLVEAIRAMDLDSMRSIYAPDIVSFDAGPPLQRVGAEAKCKNWEEAFTVLQPPLGYDVRDLTLTVDGDLAFAHSFNRLSGTLRNGSRMGFWVRVTLCFQRIDGNWLIVHDHVSAPLDLATGRGVLDLVPPAEGG